MTHMRAYLALTLGVVGAIAGAPPLFLVCKDDDPDTDPVTTTLGQVYGCEHDGVSQYLGIPFAAPPTGDNRFRPPQDAQPWNGVRKSRATGNICPQFNLCPDLHLKEWICKDAPYIGNEDCLNLDVYVPENAGENLPVLVWIYGGGYALGDKYEFGLYNAHNIAKNQKMIVVAMNYRLGALGFFSSDELMEESGTTGNYALQDQQKAMKWVQDNIGNFGGDKDRVTIAGESAGGFSVAWHLASPQSAGLFHAAILESASFDTPQFFFPRPLAQNFSYEWSKSVGCDRDSFSFPDMFLQCIRGKSTDEWQAGTSLAPLNPVFAWGPTIDDFALTGVPYDVIKSGKFNKVPVIAGTNQNEGSIFTPAMALVVPGVSWPIKHAKDLMTVLEYFYTGSIPEEIFDAYSKQSWITSLDQMGAMLIRDFIFVCSTRRAVTAMTEHGVPAYVYHFTYKGDFIEDPILGDYHSSELEFVFDNQWPPLVHTFSKNDQVMSDTFTAYWSDLVYGGSPNGAYSKARNLNQWPVWSNATRLDMRMDVPTQVEKNYEGALCDMWDQIYAADPGVNPKYNH